MPTYVYETVPATPGEKAKLYEIQQSMEAEPLTAHPDTGEQIRRVILGGFGILSSASSGRSDGGSGSSGGCGHGCCCR